LWSSWFSNDRENAFVDGDWFCFGIKEKFGWDGFGEGGVVEEVFRK
jgi:hypothetical protein